MYEFPSPSLERLIMRVAFIGKMRSGKDTAAEFLLERSRAAIIKFADPLYDMQEAIYTIADLPYDENTKDRRLLQLLGTEWGREKDPDLWLNIFEKTVNSCKNLNIICTDCRFPNELALVKRLGFTTVKIITKDEIRMARGATNTNHESERHIDEMQADIDIYNIGTLEDFKQKILNNVA